MQSALNPLKLQPPVHKGPFVARVGLLERIERAPRAHLTIVQAPAGFGKTALLAQLYANAAARSTRAAWLSLDASDGNYARFVRSLVAALESLGFAPEREQVEQALNAGVDSPVLVGASLSSALACLEDAVVFIDDFHLAAAAEISQLVAHLLQSPGRRLSWVIATRTALAHLPVARLRAQQELVEVHAADLQFSAGEAAELLHVGSGLTLDESAVRTLHERTEGWVAALQVAILMLRSSAEPQRIVERFSAAYRNVEELLDQEVFDALDEPLRRFLLESSVLEKFSVELCNAVTERTDARCMIDRLEALNLFTYSLDDERTSYRYHRLFSEFLRRRLMETEPGRACALHSRASLWFERHGLALEAIEHALLAKDYPRAARMLDGAQLFSDGHVLAVDHYARQIPDEVLEAFPNLQLERIWEWQRSWQFTRAESALRRLSSRVRSWANGREAPPADVDLQMLQAKIAHREMLMSFAADDMKETERRCARWHSAGFAADASTERDVELARIAVQREHYRAHESIAPRSARRGGSFEKTRDYASVLYDCVCGLSLFAMGCVREAQQLYVHAFDSARQMPRSLTRPAIPGLLLAETHYEQNRLGDARDLIQRYLEVVGSNGFVDKLISGHITRARIAFVEGGFNHDAAREPLDEAERCARASGFERLRLHVLAERIRQLSLSGDRDEAFFCAKREKLLGGPSAFAPREGVTTCQELLALTWARIASLQGNVDPAQQLLKQWYRFTLARRCYRSAIGIALELAAQLYARNSRTSALNYVRNALRLGRGEFVRTFLDARPAVHSLLQEISARQEGVGAEERRYAARLVVEIREDGGISCSSPPMVTETSVLASLNRRETDILELAAEDLSNRQIARRLALSENTVKWYWKAIFKKLRVHRRAKAVTLARSTGMIF